MRTSRVSRRPPKDKRTPAAAGARRAPQRLAGAARPPKAPEPRAAAARPTPLPSSRKRRRPQRDPDPGHVAVGRVLAPFGVKGELRVQPLTDNTKRFRAKARLLANDEPVTIAASREAQGYVYLTFRGFRDRDSVERFRHTLLQVPEEDLPALPEGAYYRFQLVDCTVVDRAGTELGTVEEVLETGANDVLRVRTPDGKDLLLPLLEDVVLSVDVAARRIVADPPEWR